MADLREEVPREFADDERWYRFFTRKSILVLLIMGVISLLIVKFFMWMGIHMVGIYIALALLGIVMLLVMLPVPEGDILHGSGCTCDIILLRLLIHRKKAKIYMKGYREERD